MADQTRDRNVLIDPIDLGYLDLERSAYAFLVRRTGHAPILVECGTAACQPRLERALAERGMALESIAAVAVTHIHLDHAGGAGHWTGRGVPILVHPFGVRHLADPSKLIASSRRVHGPAYDRHYGDPLPCAEALLRPMADRASTEVAGLRLTAIETPGHARHHHAWCVEPAVDDVLPGERHLFTGDVAAMCVPGSRFLSVPTPPPEFDLVAWRRSLDTLADLVRRTPATLWLTHGGRMPDVAAHLGAVRKRLEAEVALMTDLLSSLDGVAPGGPEEAAAIDRYGAWLWPQAAAAGVSEAGRHAFLGPAFCRMNLAGARRWREQEAKAGAAGSAPAPT